MESAGKIVDEVVEDNPSKRLKTANTDTTVTFPLDDLSISHDKNMKVCLMCTRLNELSIIESDCLCGDCYNSFATAHIDNIETSVFSASCLNENQCVVTDKVTANIELVEDGDTRNLSQISAGESQAEGVDLFM
jgi:hypothetical protein